MKNEPKATALPAGIIASDLKRPKWSSKVKMADDVGDYGALTFYEVKSFGWCLATLGISRGRAGNAARTYAARVSNGGTVRIGNGPHVLRTITVYVKESRRKALEKYITMYHTGASNANVIRDRISSRRAQGALERSLGHRSWRWEV